MKIRSLSRAPTYHQGLRPKNILTTHQSTRPTLRQRLLQAFRGPQPQTATPAIDPTAAITPPANSALPKIKMMLIGRSVNARGEWENPFKKIPGLTAKAHDEGLLGGFAGDFPDMCSTSLQALMENPPNGVEPYIIAGFEDGQLVLCTFAYKVKIHDTQYTPADLEKLQIFARKALEATGVSTITDLGDKYLATLNKTMFFGTPWGDMHTLPIKKGDGTEREEARKDAFLDFVTQELVSRFELDRAVCFNWSHEPFHANMPFEDFRGALKRSAGWVDVSGNNTSNQQIGPIAGHPELALLYQPYDVYYQQSFDRCIDPVDQRILLGNRDLYEAYEIAKNDWFNWAKERIGQELGPQAPRFKDVSYPNQEDWAPLIESHPHLAAEIFLKFPAIKYLKDWAPKHITDKTGDWQPVWSDRLIDNCDRFVLNGLMINGFAEIRSRIIFDELMTVVQGLEKEAKGFENLAAQRRLDILRGCAPQDEAADLPRRDDIILAAEAIQKGETPECFTSLSPEDQARARTLVQKTCERLDGVVGNGSLAIVKSLKAQEKIDAMLAIVPENDRLSVFSQILDLGKKRTEIESKVRALLRATVGQTISRPPKPNGKVDTTVLSEKMIDPVARLITELMNGADPANLNDAMKKTYTDTFKVLPSVPDPNDASKTVSPTQIIEDVLIPEMKGINSAFDGLCRTYRDTRPIPGDEKKSKQERYLDGNSIIQQKKQLDENSRSIPAWWQTAAEAEKTHLRGLMQINVEIERLKGDVAKIRQQRIKTEIERVNELKKKVDNEVENKKVRMQDDMRAAYIARRRTYFTQTYPELGRLIEQVGIEQALDRIGEHPIDRDRLAETYGRAFLDEVIERPNDPAYYRKKVLIEVLDMLDPRVTDEFFHGLFTGYMNIHDKADLKWDFYTPSYARRFAQLGPGVEITGANMEYLIRHFHFSQDRALQLLRGGSIRGGNAKFTIPNTVIISIREEGDPYPRTATIARIAKNRQGKGIIMPHRISCQPGSDAFEDYRTNAVVCCEIGAAMGLDGAEVGPTLEGTKQNNFGLEGHKVRHFVYHNPERDPLYSAQMSVITLMVMDNSHGARLDAKQDVVRSIPRAPQGSSPEETFWKRWGVEAPFKTRT